MVHGPRRGSIVDQDDMAAAIVAAMIPQWLLATLNLVVAAGVVTTRWL